MAFDARAHVLHMARMLDLPLEKADLEAVVQNMDATAAAAALVMAAGRDDRAEPASVFVAGLGAELEAGRTAAGEVEP